MLNQLMQKISFVLLLIIISYQAHAFFAEFPKKPDSRLTPGMLCEMRIKFRYLEKIPYCERDVAPETKLSVYQSYRRLGFSLNSSKENYKIDHFYPLCAGGSNQPANLWPQHISLFSQTDQLEFLICEKMKQGLLSQKDGLALIRKGKFNLPQIPSIIHGLESLR